jgi:aquaporin Z
MSFRWPLYMFEGAELALFMISACVLSVLLFDPSSAVQKELPDPILRRLLMGVSMGVTAVLIIQSSMGNKPRSSASEDLRERTRC